MACAEDAGDPTPPSNPEPFTLAELPVEDQKLTGWRMVKRIHEAAVADERDTYVDPASGMSAKVEQKATSMALAAHTMLSLMAEEPLCSRVASWPKVLS